MRVNDLAVFGGKPAFDKPRSTSNLVKPSKEAFLNYLQPEYINGNLAGNGKLIAELEERLAQIHGSKYCITVCNGLWGLVLTINELRLKGKNEIIMPSLTYRRMADIAAWLKMIPHFCDVDTQTMGISPETAEKCINENTALIMAPHPIVNLCDVYGMINLAEKYSLPLIFDTVEATYACIGNKPLGSFGDAEVFSVHASKFLNGFEGGYITTNNASLAERLKAARQYGINEHGELVTTGINGNMIAPHAAMTMACLDEVEEQVARNKIKFYKYKELLCKIEGINLVEYSSAERRSFKNILIKLDEKWPFTREETLAVLQKENMVVRPYYYPPLHLKTTTYPVITGDMTNTERLMKNHMLLPCGEFVSTEDIEIIAGYFRFLKENHVEIKSGMETAVNG